MSVTIYYRRFTNLSLLYIYETQEQEGRLQVMAISRLRSRQEIRDKVRQYMIVNSICTKCYSRYVDEKSLQCEVCRANKRRYRKKHREYVRKVAREYARRPEVKARRKIYMKEYMANYSQMPENKE